MRKCAALTCNRNCQGQVEGPRSPIRARDVPLMTHRTWLATPIIVLASTASRLTFQHSVETRYQILAFWIIALGCEIYFLTRNGSVIFYRLFANLALATACITLVRRRLEGLPLSRLSHIL